MKNALKLFLCTILLTASSRARPVFAQEPDYWSPAQRIPGYLDDTLPPILIADQNQTVHAFASQWTDSSKKNRVIVYRKWNKITGWTPPIDIILPSASGALIQDALLDKTGKIHLIFWGGDVNGAGIYYSNAVLSIADRTRAWSEPRLIGPSATEPGLATISGDENGRVIVLYRGNLEGGGLYSTLSSDGGQTWTEPSVFYISPNTDLTPAYLSVAKGMSNQIHVVWCLTNNMGRAFSAIYARYNLETADLSSPIILAEDKLGDVGAGVFGPTYPAIIAVKNRVVVLYNANGGPDTLGRPALWVRLSDDNGETWTEPSRPWPNHVGLNGMFSLVVDGSDKIHAVFIQRIERNLSGKNAPIGGMWHSVLVGDYWTNPDRIDQNRMSTYDIRAVISQGNYLLATWREDPGLSGQGVFYSYTVLDANSFPVIPLPTQSPVDVEPTEPISDVLSLENTANVSGNGLEESLLTPAPVAGESFLQNPTYLVLLSLIPTLMIIGLILIVRNRATGI